MACEILIQELDIEIGLLEAAEASLGSLERYREELYREVDVRQTADDEVILHDLRQDPAAAKRAESYGINTVPAVVVDDSLAGCCRNTGPTREELLAAGVGSA